MAPPAKDAHGDNQGPYNVDNETTEKHQGGSVSGNKTQKTFRDYIKLSSDELKIIEVI